MRSLRRVLPWLVLSTACSPTVGSQCDIDVARTIVYGPGGEPAYVGQSMLITSCADNGGHCHADGARDRYGAPFGMNFDPVLANSLRFDSEHTGAVHLYAAQIASHRLRDDIFAQVVSGEMPPVAIGAASVAAPYRHYADATDLMGTAVPALTTAEGREALRNWLACGSPVVESTTPPDLESCATDADCLTHHCDASTSQCVAVGAVVAARVVTQPHWQSIYDTILLPTCATVGCHDAADAMISGDLDLSSPTIAYTALFNQPASVSGCGTRIVAGNPTMSFLLQKLQDTQNHGTCGDRMPLGGALSADQIAAVQTWIMNGALMTD